MENGNGYECFCGKPFDSRDGLVEHNVTTHAMSPDESRRAVDDKYPQ